jgi:putative restriction endonuclease
VLALDEGDTEGASLLATSTQEQLWEAIAANLPRGTWVPLQSIYELVREAVTLTPEDHEPEVEGSAQERWQRNVRNVLQRRKADGEVLWDQEAHYMLPPRAAADSGGAAAPAEAAFRLSLWQKLLDLGVSEACPPALLWELRIRRGEQGIYRDMTRTAHLTPQAVGVTMSVLHLGESYPDNLGERELRYHYPRTNRPEAYDRGEVEATKAAHRLAMPLFAILPSEAGANARKVRLAWVEDWADGEDGRGVFVISFDEEAARQPCDEVREEAPFELVDERLGDETITTTRPGQQKFKFRVLQRYGARCAVCGLAFREVLDAVHIRPKGQQGSDHAGNGLVLCASHHRAFDAGLFSIDPETLALRPGGNVAGLDVLRINVQDLSHLPAPPAREALAWRWQQRRDSSLRSE